MKNKLKNERGITMIILVIIIVLMLILTVTGVYTGIDAYKTMKTQTFIAQMKVLREKINIIRDEYKNWDKYTGNNIREYILEEYVVKDASGTIISEPIDLSIYPDTHDTKFLFMDILASKTKLTGEDLILSNYLYFTKNDLEELFGLTNIDLNVIINFNTGACVERDGIDATTFLGATTHFYVLDELIASQNAYFNSAGSGSVGTGESATLTIESVQIKKFDDATNKVIIGIKTNSLKEFTNISMYNTKGEIVLDNISFTRENVDVELAIQNTHIGFFTFSITDTETTAKSPVLEIIRTNPPTYISNGVTKVAWNGDDEYEPVNDTEWYIYGVSNKKWANIKLADGSYYVWIPRFAYKIDSSGNISIKFLKGTSNVAYDGTIVSDSYDTDAYIVHPAFREGVINTEVQINEKYGHGEFTKQLSGFWIAKYETFMEEVPEPESGPKYLFRSYPGKKLQDNPGISFNNLIRGAREIECYLDLYGFTDMNSNYSAGRGTVKTDLTLNSDKVTNVDTHMIKNSEWGAVSYLALSDYGVNEYYVNSPSMITGEKDAESIEDEYARTSTTGNMFGVFDLTNGNTEYVAVSTENNYSSYSDVKPTQNGVIKSNQYATVFDTTFGNNQKIGDGIYEFRLFNSFEQDQDKFLTDSNCVLTRGGDGYLSYLAVPADSTTENGKIGFRIIMILE